MSDSPYAFENLTHSGLASFTAKENRDVSLSVSAFGGRAQLAVFTKGGGKPFSLTLPEKSIAGIKKLIRKMIENPKPCREPIMLGEWDVENKRVKQIGQLGIGLDDALTFTIDLAHNNLDGRHLFPVKPDIKFDFSNTSLTEKEQVQAMLEYVLDLFTIAVPLAQRFTSFKRPNAGGFGNKGGGSYGGNKGGYNSGGNSGGGYNRGGGGGSSVNDDLQL